MVVNVNVLILRTQPPDAAVTVHATFLIGSKQISTNSGEFYAGLEHEKKPYLSFEWFKLMVNGVVEFT